MTKNNIVELINDLYGIQPVKVSTSKGGEFHSPCPGCAGNDRFHIWPSQNNEEGSYWCRGCGKGGDAIQFLRDFSGMTFKEAALKIGRIFEPVRSSLQSYAPRKSNRFKWEPAHKERPSSVQDQELWEQRAGKFVESCHLALLDSKKHLDWLADRGITQGSTVKWKLGLHVTKEMKSSFRPRTSWGLSGGKNPKTGKPFMFVLPAGIVIPWLDKNGNIQRIRIRIENLDTQEPQKRYHAVAGSIMSTFMTRLNASVYAVVETELDAIMLDEVAGDLVGVVAVGSSHAKPTNAAGEAILKSSRVINALDYDTAGTNAVAWWAKNVSHSIRRPVPVGCDPGEFFEQAGPEMVRGWILKGMPAANQLSVAKQKNRIASSLDDREGVSPCSCKSSPFVDDHPKVRHLAKLLRLCPVAIKKTSTYYGLVTLQGYDKKKHWDCYCEISKLILSEPAISYLHGLQNEIITSNNINF